MSLLDNRSLIKQIDPNNYLSHILDVSEQLTEGYRLAESIILPAMYAQSKQVVLATSGELMPVATLLQSLMLDYARVPIVCVDDYSLPHWVSNDTLVITLDYSGTTEQTLLLYREAAKRRARLLAVSTGGELAREARRTKSVHVTLSYGAPPRAAFYYCLGCLAHLLKRLDLLEMKEATVAEAGVLCQSLLESVSPEVAYYQNRAKQLAEKVLQRKTIIVGSGLLSPMAKKWQLAFASTGKTITVAATLSEFNDALLNGLGLQTKLNEAPLVILLQSKYDHQRNKLQQTLTYQVAQVQKFLFEQVFMHPSGSPFGEVVLSSLLADMVSYYLAWLNNRDPSTLEASQFIKERLSNQALFE